MADDIDRAQEHEQASRDAALAARVVIPTPGDGSLICVRCHDDVPRKRAALGYRTCVDCQQIIERAGR